LPALGFVSALIIVKLFLPELSIGLRNFPEVTTMSMPEAAVYKNCPSTSAIDYVGCAWEIAGFDAEAIPKRGEHVLNR
jgi:hypothetical protein